MADWFAVYREADGELISEGTVVPDVLRSGLAKKNLGPGRPTNRLWNKTTLEFDAAPAPPPDVDRVDEVIAAMTRNGGRFTESEVRREVALLLGSQRFRDHKEARDLE